MIKLTRCYIVVEFWKDSGILNVGGVYLNLIDAEDYAEDLQYAANKKGMRNVEYSVIERPLHPRNWNEVKATYYGWE